ncbi:class I SAM-dependent methyltransferase [Streptomyces sp. 6N223]|uniref:class I SAM-dependent methyltransferase n=1 Tax=Streptomyces sp. 6N223 TaxID=3457412 RepID=UPI003FCF2449
MGDTTFRPTLGAVEETLLITLYGRAVETRDQNGLLDDPAAVAMVEAIDYDFAKFDGKPSLPRACLRTLTFDHWVRAFLAEHPAGTVVEVGAGLNTRFERVDNGRVRWIDLDLPGAIALRRRFFREDEPRREMLAASVLDTSWMDRAAGLPGPWFFSIEAVLPYLAEDRVRWLFAELTRRFPGSRLATDIATTAMVANQGKHDVVSMMAARFDWACDEPRDVESWAPGVRLAEECTLATLPEELVAGFSPARRERARTAAETVPEKFGSSRLSLFQLRGPEDGAAAPR